MAGLGFGAGFGVGGSSGGEIFGDGSGGAASSKRNKKDEKLYQRLQTKLSKMNNMEEENRRILAKEGGAAGMSEGQAAQKRWVVLVGPINILFYTVPSAHERI
jgi:hypothetical protein